MERVRLHRGHLPRRAAPRRGPPGSAEHRLPPAAQRLDAGDLRPLTTSAPLSGSGGPDENNWLTDATGVYANPGRSGVWANVFAATGAAITTPFVYFARAPSAERFCKADAPAGSQNRAEFGANFYAATQPGQLRFEIRQRDALQTFVGRDTVPGGTGWNPTVNSSGGQNLFQVAATGSARGPQGGYVPYAYDLATEAGKPMRIAWTFTPSGGAPVSGSQDFTTLAGPDADGDEVVDSADACPAVRGTTANGCLPTAPPAAAVVPQPFAPAAPAPGPGRPQARPGQLARSPSPCRRSSSPRSRCGAARACGGAALRKGLKVKDPPPHQAAGCALRRASARSRRGRIGPGRRAIPPAPSGPSSVLSAA